MTTLATKLIRWTAALLAVAVAAAAVVIWATPVLGLRTITVTGVHNDELVTMVREAADVADGKPLARLDLDAVGQRVAAVPAVARSSVERQWPHTLVISVTPRTAVATTQANGRWWRVDADGVPFAPQQDRPADLMPLLLTTPGPQDPATDAALSVLASLPTALRTRTARIAAPSAYQVTLTLTDGRVAVWGDASQTAAKARVLTAMLDQPGQRFDVSDPTLVTVRGADEPS